MSVDAIQGNDFLFDNFIVNASGTMTFHGQDISIPPKEFQVLVALLEGRGNLVLKNFIIDKVWGDTLVGDESLTRCIYSLRRLLRESKNNKFIETVYGKGYRFCKPVTLVPRQRQEKQDCTLAVFPFCSADKTEAMLLQARLLDLCSQANVPGLAIVPAMLTREFVRLDEIVGLCHQLEIDCYLSGEFAQIGNEQVLAVELIDAETQRLLFRDTLRLAHGETWSERMRRLSTVILENLPLHLPELPAEAPGEVMLSHVMARRCLRRRGHGDINLAQQYLQMGLLQDPHHVPSLTSMAEAHLAHAMQGGIWPQRALTDAGQLLDRAMSLAPGHAMTMVVTAWQLSLSGDTPALAGGLFRRAEASAGAPGELYFYLGLHLCAQGELTQALEQMDICLARDGDVALVHVFRLWLQLALGQSVEALAEALRDLDAFDRPPLYLSVLAWGLAEAGDEQQAGLYANMALETAPASLPERIFHATVQAVGEGHPGARSMLSRWVGEVHARYRCPGLLANLALSLGELAQVRMLAQLARDQRCMWWPLVRVMPRMAAFLATEPQIEHFL
jgi:DNA-binding winged helix-turn-helix (wHTH) protein/Tfp pilus assembly protein PilF